MKKIIGIIGLAFLGWTSGAGAQTATLEQAIRTTWENSPQLKAQNTLAGIYSDDTWRRFIPQEPQLSYSEEDNNAEQTWGLSIDYPIPFKSLAYTQLDEAIAQQQRLEFRAQKYDLAVTVAQAYMNCATDQAMIIFQTQNVQDLETITEAIHEQYIHGHSNQTQEISAELQLTQAQRDLKTAQDQLETAVELYSKLMNIPSDQVQTFELPEDVPPSIITELGDRTSAQMRDKASVNVGEANRAMGFWSQIPDLNLSVSQNQWINLPASPSGLQYDYTFGVAITIPILFPFHEVAEASRAENQGIVNREMARLQLVQDDSAEKAGALDYERSLARYQQLHDKDLILAETMKESAVEAYKRGTLQFSDLMLARQTYASLKTEDIQIRAEIVNAHLTGLKNIAEADEKSAAPAVTGGTAQ
jgi:outer membrane protein TolC